MWEDYTSEWIILVWSLLSLFLIKFLPGAFLGKFNYKLTLVGIYFVSRLVSNCIFLILAILALIFLFSYALLAALPILTSI